MILLTMKIVNSSEKYGLVAKLFHWITFVVLVAQVPFGFYLVGLEFSDRRIDLENIHILIGISIFYFVLIRLIWKLFNPSPKSEHNLFKGQALIAQVPFGFYLVGLEFSDRRIDLENIHILIGITIFYFVLLRLIWKLFNPSLKSEHNFFKGQNLVTKIKYLPKTVVWQDCISNGILYFFLIR